MTEKQIERILKRLKLKAYKGRPADRTEIAVEGEEIPFCIVHDVGRLDLVFDVMWEEKIIPIIAKHISSEMEKLQENQSNIHPDAEGVLDMLNTLCGREFRPTDANLEIISARLNEKDITAGEIGKMIKHQVEKWKGTDMEEYLRPSTLFRASKFDNYYANRDMPVRNEAQHKRAALRGENC